MTDLMGGRKHGYSFVGKVHYLYRRWTGIKDRCYNRKSERFKYYGMRGIVMAPHWVEDFICFKDYILTYLGERPTKKHSLDRIDNDKGYDPGNLRWATHTEQMNNRSNNVFLEFNGENKSLAEWSKITAIGKDIIHQRIKRDGWTVERALTQDVRKRGINKHV